MSILFGAFPYVIQALNVTVYVLVMSTVLGILLGILYTFGKLSKNKIIHAISSVLVSFFRGVPMPALLFLIFFGTPEIVRVFGIDANSWSPEIFAIISFTLNSSAFFEEIFRAAYLSIEKGQIEAAQSIGMTKLQTFRRVILPQAAVSALPNLSNMVIELLKNTALAFSVGVVDMMGKADQYSAANYGVGQAWIYLATGIIYWALTVFIDFAFRLLNRKLDKGRKGNISIPKSKYRLGKGTVVAIER